MKYIKILTFTSLIILFNQIELHAESLKYKEVLNKAIENSFDLKMSAADIGISKAQLKSARADWFPSVNLQFNSEYNKDLKNGIGQYAYAGNTVISPYTQFRDLFYLTVSYNLFDFGVTGKKVHIAKKDFEQKQIAYNLQLKELKLKILDLYTKTQNKNIEISTKSEILEIYKTMFKNKERIYKAGLSNKISIMDEAIKIAKIQNELENSKLELKNSLQDLSYYTLEDYDYKNIQISNIEDDENTIIEKITPNEYKSILKTKIKKEEYEFKLDPINSLESKYYDLEVEKKKAELSILKRERLPSFKFYTGYSLYGQDPNQYFGAFQDMGARNLILGISSSYILFDGFKNRANQEKAKLEIEKLQYEKNKKIVDLQRQYHKTYQTYETYNEELKIKKELLRNVQEKIKAMSRLSQNKLLSKNEYLDAKAELLNQELELEENIISITSKIEELKIIAGQDL